MDMEKMNDVLDGRALLETINGDYYDYCGHCDGGLLFQNITDDSYILVDAVEDVVEIYPEACVVYPEELSCKA